MLSSGMLQQEQFGVPYMSVEVCMEFQAVSAGACHEVVDGWADRSVDIIWYV